MASLALAFDILARDRGASRTFDKVGDAADRAGKKGQTFGSRIQSGFGKLAKVGFLAGSAATAIGGIAVAAGSMGVKTAAANEQAEIAFTTMLGSAKKAGAFLKDLQAFAAKTPFEFPELQTAASSLISAGINANKVIPIMTTLGDVTAGMGTGSEGVKRATVALQQMSAAGRITGEDLNQLRDAGIPVYDLLSKATGKSKAEVVKLAQAGKLGKKELGQMMKALESGKGLERFSGLMDKQSASLTGMWSTFKDTLGQGLAKAIQPVIPLLKDGLGKASEFLAGILPKVAQGLASFVKWLVGSHPNIAKFIDGVKAVGHWIMSDALPAAQAFGGWLKNDLWPALKEAYQTIMPSLKRAFDTIAGAFKSTGSDGSTFGDKLREVGKVITDKVIPFIALMIKVYLPGAAAQIRGVIEVVKTLYKAFITWRNTVATVLSFIIGKLGDLMGVFGTMLEALSHVPGFGWAKDAAAKLKGAADKAHALAAALAEIPTNKTVTVNTYFQTHGVNPLSTKGSGAGIKGYASGGSNLPRGWRIAGEKGPELQWSPGGDTIIPASRTRALLNGGGGGSVSVTQHFHGITDAQEAAAASVSRLTHKVRVP